MRERIVRGEVPGITNPDMAEQIVKQGEVTYKQARNIARAGNIDSIVFDVKSQAVISAYVFAISFPIQLAICKWNGTPTAQAIQSAIVSGLATGGTTLATGVLSAHVLRTKAAAAGPRTVREGMRFVASTTAGRKVLESVVQGSLGKAVYGAAAVNHAAKLLRSNLITSGVVALVTTAPDFYRAAIARNISWQQFMKNGVVTVAGVGAGAGGALAGAAAGVIGHDL